MTHLLKLELSEDLLALLPFYPLMLDTDGVGVIEEIIDGMVEVCDYLAAFGVEA